MWVWGMDRRRGRQRGVVALQRGGIKGEVGFAGETLYATHVGWISQYRTTASAVVENSGPCGGPARSGLFR